MAIAIERVTRVFVYGRPASKLGPGDWLVLTNDHPAAKADVRALVDAGVAPKYWNLDESNAAIPRVTEMSAAEKTAVDAGTFVQAKNAWMRELASRTDDYFDRRGYPVGRIVAFHTLAVGADANHQLFVAPFVAWSVTVLQHVATVEAAISASVDHAGLNAAKALLNYNQFNATDPKVRLGDLP